MKIALNTTGHKSHERQNPPEPVEDISLHLKVLTECCEVLVAQVIETVEELEGTGQKLVLDEFGVKYSYFPLHPCELWHVMCIPGRRQYMYMRF